MLSRRKSGFLPLEDYTRVLTSVCFLLVINYRRHHVEISRSVDEHLSSAKGETEVKESADSVTFTHELATENVTEQLSQGSVT
jgi:hypothetical protein